MSYLPFKQTYPTPEIFFQKCVEYFETTRAGGKALSLQGLRLHLDVARETLRDYAKKPGYDQVYDWCRTTIEEFLNNKLITENKPVGSIFALKAQYGWSDQPQNKGDNNTFIYVFGNEAKQLRQDLKLLEEPPIDAEAREVVMPEMVDAKRKKTGKKPKGKQFGNVETQQDKAHKAPKAPPRW